MNSVNVDSEQQILGDASMPRRLRRMLPFLAVATIIVVCVSHMYAVTGVRGTDQYWYLSDVTALANGEPPVTNTVFAGNVLRSDGAEQITYFAHNGPMLYLVAAVARVWDPVASWKYVNLVLFLAAAVLTGLTVRYLSSSEWALISVIVFLTTPINVWLASNFLQEMFFCFLAAVILHASVTDSGSLMKRSALLVALAAGTLSHPLYLIVGLCLALYLLLFEKQRWMPLIISFTVIVSHFVKDDFFPTSFPPTITDLITASVPGVANSIWQLTDSVPSLTPGFLWNKFTHALSLQFMPSVLSPLYLVSNVGLLAFLCLLSRVRQINVRFMYMAAAFMLCYGGMIVLMQNQMRYQLFITPISVACIVLWVSGWTHLRTGIAVLVVAVSSCLVINYSLLKKVRVEGLVESQELALLEENLDFLEPDDRVALLADNLGGWLSTIHTLDPIKAMPVFPSLLTDGRMERAIALFDPHYLFVREGVDLQGLSGFEHMKSLKDAGPFDLEIYAAETDGH